MKVDENTNRISEIIQPRKPKHSQITRCLKEKLIPIQPGTHGGVVGVG